MIQRNETAGRRTPGNVNPTKKHRAGIAERGPLVIKTDEIIRHCNRFLIDRGIPIHDFSGNEQKPNS